MRGGTDYVLFESDVTTEETITHGSLELYLDSSYRTHENARNYGTVIQIPFQLSKTIIGQTGERYSENPDFIFIKDIPQIIQKGDRIYFHYNVLGEESNRYEPIEKIFGARYDQIYCLVRDGQIIPVGQWVLCEPIAETWDDITLPSGLVVKSAPGHLYRIGKVAYMPEITMKGMHEDLQVGEYVLIKNNADLEVEIEEKTYYICRQKHIMAKGELEDLKKIKL